MKESYISKGNRVTLVIERVRKDWKPIESGVKANDTLNGLYSDTETVTKSINKFKTKSQILVYEDGQTSEQRQQLAAALQQIYDNRPVLNEQVKKFHTSYKDMLNAFKSNYPKGTIISLSDDNVKYINDTMLELSLGLIYKCKIIITRIEEEQFNGSRANDPYFVKTKTLASLYFKTLDELYEYIKDVVKPAFDAEAETSISQTKSSVELYVTAENETPLLYTSKLSAMERLRIHKKSLDTKHCTESLLDKLGLVKVGPKPNC